MTTTSDDSIVAFIKEVRAQDRRADRERIAELERDNNAVVQCCAELREAIDVYLAEIQRLNEKCAALVVERDHIKAQFAEAFGEQRERAFDKMAKPLVKERDAPTLRIDTDMSDPQPGKLLVVRLDDHDQVCMHRGLAVTSSPSQFVGFLVEMPAVEVKTISGGVTTTNSPFPWESRK